MVSKYRVLSALVLALAICASAWFRWDWVRRRMPSGEYVAVLDRSLPPLLLEDTSGHRVDAARAAIGRKTVIAFYSPSCQVCEEVLPELEGIPGGLQLILVNERPGSTRDKLSTAPGLRGALHLRDPDGVFFRSFPLTPVPTIIFVDAAGRLRGRVIGRQAPGQLKERLMEFANGAS